MKLRIMLTLAVLAICFSLLSCITSREISVEISCDQFSENQHAMSEFQAAIGDKITVKLCSNPTTGFEWKYETIGAVILQEEDRDFTESEDEGIVGAAGTDVWTFEALKTGTTEVRMEYSRDWEGGEQAEWTYTMKVTVE